MSQNHKKNLVIMERLYFVETHKRRVCLNKISKVLAQRSIESELKIQKRTKASNHARECRRLLLLYKTEPRLSKDSQELKRKKKVDKIGTRNNKIIAMFTSYNST